ncbi:FAR1-related sequence 10 [Tanacetum coccineum]
MKIHHDGRFTNPPGKKYVDGESLDYEEKVFYHYKIPLKGLDIGLRLLASDIDINEMVKYVHKHKIIYAYVEHDKSVVDPALNVDEARPSKILGHQNDEGEDEAVDEGNYDQAENEDGGQGKDYEADYRGESEEDEADDRGQSEEEDGGDDEDKNIKNIVDEVEVQMNGFKFKVEGEDVTKEMVRAHGVETRRNIMIVKNDKNKDKSEVFWCSSCDCQNDKTNDNDKGKEILDQGKKVERNTKEIAKGKKVNAHDKGKDKMVNKEEEDKSKCLDGFRASGRDLLGLDGAFMRGQYSGKLLTVVGVDANSDIYPVAYGLVESESTYLWTWFLTCLCDDLDLFTNSNFTFIIDRQKVSI